MLLSRYKLTSELFCVTVSESCAGCCFLRKESSALLVFLYSYNYYIIHNSSARSRNGHIAPYYRDRGREPTWLTSCAQHIRAAPCAQQFRCRLYSIRSIAFCCILSFSRPLAQHTLQDAFQLLLSINMYYIDPIFLYMAFILFHLLAYRFEFDAAHFLFYSIVCCWTGYERVQSCVVPCAKMAYSRVRVRMTVRAEHAQCMSRAYISSNGSHIFRPFGNILRIIWC
jgi:hypothetical protein